MGQNEITIRLTSGGTVTFNLTEDALTLSTSGTRRFKSGARQVKFTYRQVINASFRPADGILHVAFLARHKDTKKYYLYRYYGSVNEASTNSASEWVEALMHAAYEGAFFSVPTRSQTSQSFTGVGITRSRRLRILVNPHGGTVRVHRA
jgi:sphingosine kinase